MNICFDCKKAKKSSYGLFCKKCGYLHRTRPKGLKYVKHKENPTSFKKGHITWNTNTKGLMPEPWNKNIKGIHLSIKTEFKKGQNKGLENSKWKGDNVGYFALHTWLNRNFKKSVCEFCGGKSNVEWANKTYNYLRDRDDWLNLCTKCHKKYDSINGWGLATKKFNLNK